MTAPTQPCGPLLQGQISVLEARFSEQLLDLPTGAQVVVRTAGRALSASTVVLLHGISSGAASWLHVAVPLSEHAHVVAWNAPGYGKSTPLPTMTPIGADYASRLHEALGVMGVTRCTLVGHSLGALIALAYARLPGHCTLDRIVLISPASGYGAADKAASQTRVRQERREALASLGVIGLAQKTMGRLLSPHADQSMRAWVQWNAAQLNPSGYLQAVELLCQSDLTAGESVLVPTEVHCGDLDVVTPPDVCKVVAKQLGVPFFLIPQAGHASPAEQAMAVVHIIANALENHNHDA